MGIHDRDYMKRPPKEPSGNGTGTSLPEKLENLAQDLFGRHRRLTLTMVAVLALLLLIGLAIALLT